MKKQTFADARNSRIISTVIGMEVGEFIRRSALSRDDSLMLGSLWRGVEGSLPSNDPLSDPNGFASSTESSTRKYDY